MVSPIMDNILQDVVTIGMLGGALLWAYMRWTKKKFSDVKEELKEVFQNES